MKGALRGIGGAFVMKPGLGTTASDYSCTMSTDAESGAELLTLTIDEASRLVHAKRISPIDLAKACLARIERLNPSLNAFVNLAPESALAHAREAEAEVQRGKWRGPLHGIPIGLKDLLDTAGVRTTAASALFKDRIPTDDAEVVRRLKAAGAVILGKLNLHEFAYGGSSVISYFGPVHNPWELGFSTGGSSGGSAAAVAAELCYGAIGSDTGGSIRQPAAYCGIVGLKPTYGRVSVKGVIPLSWSLDHLGPMTRTVRDAALMLQVIAGYDPNDTGSTDTPVQDYTGSLAANTSSLRLGIPHAHFYEGLHPEIQAAMDGALAVLQKFTSSQREIKIPVANDTALAVQKAEAYSYHREYVAKNPELYQPDTLKRIRGGAEISTPDYISSRRQLDQFRRSAASLFKTVDLIIMPTTPVPPFTISELLKDPDHLRAKELVTVQNTRPFNLLGLPTISVPCGFTQRGLPIGMQISGPPRGEAVVLRLAYAYEQATEWHKRKPKLL
jgi:aspartyl-tRNA(Asn)/glutamyl-tRNA(Gln) amidotransferase subunit A